MSDSVLHVIGAARRSVFDRVRPDDVGAQGDRIRGPGGMALAALRNPGVSGGDTTAAHAVVIGGRAFGSGLDGWISTTESQAVAVGYGVAAIRTRRTAGGATWVLTRVGTLRDGAVMEAMATLPGLPPAQLVPLFVGDGDDGGWAIRMLTALGVEAHAARNDDPWSVLSAMDRAARSAESRSTAVVATRPQR